MTEETMTAAPEIKAVPETMNAAFDEFMSAFETFKETNDRRLEELSKKMSADALTDEKLERINKAMDEQKRVLDHLALKKARPALGRSSVHAIDAIEHKQAFENYIRRGDESGLKEIEAKALSAGTGADGGYTVPDEVDSEIGRRLAAISPVRALATVRQVSSNVLKKPFAVDGMSTGWVAETGARAQTATPQLAELSFPVMELYAMPAATPTLLEDSAVDIEAWIAGEVDIAFAEQEGAAFINGDGTNKPTGILSYTTVADDSWSWGKLGYVATGASGAFAASGPSDTLIEAIYALKAGYRQNATILMNRQTQGQIRKFKDADGNYLWLPPSGPGQAASLMGYPVMEAEDMPDVGAGSYSIAVGDFRSGYLVVDRTGVQVLRDPYSAKPYVLFYTTKRVGGGVQNFEAIKLVKFAAS
ncbi:phage major capsid protein [Rhizobium sp. L1K21]|uniref:phage major capsid protein n=1 Tax=Rhizobium sp. L1K21 TaxID=2954933 RepID=UPI0020933336|nr:phage major capsid protein [Rhizobium sp. L1K21]MCO6186693.1 phage major capsid protein [Rhizobium sp. L1K21]